MNQYKGTLAKPGKEAPILLPLLKVHLYLSAASPQNRLVFYYLLVYFFKGSVFFGFIYLKITYSSAWYLGKCGPDI